MIIRFRHVVRLSTRPENKIYTSTPKQTTQQRYMGPGGSLNSQPNTFFFYFCCRKNIPFEEKWIKENKNSITLFFPLLFPSFSSPISPALWSLWSCLTRAKACRSTWPAHIRKYYLPVHKSTYVTCESRVDHWMKTPVRSYSVFSSPIIVLCLNYFSIFWKMLKNPLLNNRMYFCIIFSIEYYVVKSRGVDVKKRNARTHSYSLLLG